MCIRDRFKEGAVGKDSVGSGDMKVLKQDGKSEATAKVVEGPNGMSALEFNRDYALAKMCIRDSRSCDGKRPGDPDGRRRLADHQCVRLSAPRGPEIL